MKYKSILSCGKKGSYATPKNVNKKTEVHDQFLSHLAEESIEAKTLISKLDPTHLHQMTAPGYARET